jgi:diaminopimelate decarboxylase
MDGTMERSQGAIGAGRDYLLPAGEVSPNRLLLPRSACVDAADHLEIGGCDVVELVARFGSPLYILDEATFRAACRAYREAFEHFYPGEARVLYASKAWSCLALCALAWDEGLGIDAVSEGELAAAFRAGVPGADCYLHGNNKSRAEIALAVESGATLVVDNWLELEALAEVGRVASGRIRILLRFTPGIECHTHEYIRTGHLDSKFGFDPDEMDAVLEWVARHRHLDFAGFHAHIGSQILELAPHRDLAPLMAEWMERAAALGLAVRDLDIGGGLGMRYTEDDDPPPIEAWVEAVSQAVAEACRSRSLPLPRLLAEPGRSLVGSAGVTAYRVGSRKEIPGVRTFLSVDGGMSDNPRPITYRSRCRVVAAGRMSVGWTQKVAVVGKHCETGDILIQEADLPEVTVGDVLVVLGTGAYNYSMASNYNRIPRPAAVLVGEGRAEIIVERETVEDLLRQDRLPGRLRLAGR